MAEHGESPSESSPAAESELHRHQLSTADARNCDSRELELENVDNRTKQQETSDVARKGREGAEAHVSRESEAVDPDKDEAAAWDPAKSCASSQRTKASSFSLTSTVVPEDSLNKTHSATTLKSLAVKSKSLRDRSASIERIRSAGAEGGSTLNPGSEAVPCFYSLGRLLGRGTYSEVREALHNESETWFAAKIVNKKLMKGREHIVHNEINVLKHISNGHPNVLTLVDHFETDNNLYLITELAKGGELFERIYSRGSFYESDAANIVRQITSGVAHLHSYGIVHRDLKPENVLFKTTSDRSNLLICDFGLSKMMDEEKLRILMTTCGTPSYMAPEIFSKDGHGKPVDIWAIGVIAFFLLCGYTPFDRDTLAEEREAILAGEFKFEPQEYWIHVSSDARKFISTCLMRDPAKRPTAKECLEMRFLTKRYRQEKDLLPNMLSNFNFNGPNGIPSSLKGKAMNGAYSVSPTVIKLPTPNFGWNM